MTTENTIASLPTPGAAIAPSADRPAVLPSVSSRIALGATLAIVVLIVAEAALDPAALSRYVQALRESSTTFLVRIEAEIVLNPWFYGVFALVLLLEQLIPARSAQRRWSRGVRQDIVWVVPKIAAHATILPLYVLGLRMIYGKYLSFLTIQPVARWPWLAKLLLALLIGDLLFWITHVVRHKIPAFWYFHAVHHSQKELNFFTEYRVHPIDDFFIFTIGMVPFLMVEPGFATLVAVIWIRHWHTRVYHSNIRSNLGWLRYLIVTPQSHRVHHSVEPRHHDKNFGLTFSVWDYLFGTQYRGYDEYPQTGINDSDFPFEQAAPPRHQLESLFGQLLYPFRALARR